MAAIALVALRRAPGSVFMGAPIWAFLVIALTGVAGVGTWLTVRPPGDVLHVLYGVLAAAALPVTAVVARSHDGPGRAISWVVGGIVLAFLLLRLFQTGG